jgi:ABC-type dipeptide/oligopeptide/nickel transport system permease subunit
VLDVEYRRLRVERCNVKVATFNVIEIITVMSFNLLGDGVRDAVDPYA